jgi:alkylation response protein AidB-like acyl-CoA dehydrogenase
MDFTLSDEQKAISSLAGQILTDTCALERLKAVERSDAGYDANLWGELASAGLLAVALPEKLGGSDGGFLDLCLLLQEQGRRVAMVPLIPTLVAGALPLLRFGTPEQQNRFLTGIAKGKTILTAALVDAVGDPRTPTTTAAADGKGWKLAGEKIAVPFAHLAAAMLVSARTGDGRVGLFLVDPRAAGVQLTRQETMSWEPQATVTLENVQVGADALVGPLTSDGAVLNWVLDRVITAHCAVAAGACQEAMRLTAEYASNRKQFDKPIAMFQAVGQRMADCYIDNEAVTLTMLQAASRLTDEMPSDKEVATAKYWAAEGGSRIGHAALHIHGGISIDVDYPIHRYFLWLKQIENTLGAATPQLVRLGSLIASET